MSTLLGFYLGLHDSNVAVAVDGRVRYIKSERRTGLKHHHADLSFVAQMCDEWNLRKVDAICFSDGNRNGLGSCPEGQLWCGTRPIPGLPSAPTFCVDHHYGHVLSAWPIVELKSVSTGIAIDGRGDHHIRRSVIDSPGSQLPSIRYADANPTMGSLFTEIGKKMGLCSTGIWTSQAIDVPGKIMGAQAYGEINTDYINAIELERLRHNLLSLVTKIPWRGSPPEFQSNFFRIENSTFRNWLATVHKLVEMEIVDFFSRFCESNETIVYSGGCAQNVVCNDGLLGRFANLSIPPHCYDGGLSLGAIEFLRIQRGEPEFDTSGFPYWQDDLERETPSASLLSKAADRLAQGDIIGWFQGRGELGPRALGNRSILMNPTVKNGKALLNERIKRREYWRPYGGTILESETIDWFGKIIQSPFMLRTILIPKSMRDSIPNIVHEDGTCRIQTLRYSQNPIFAELLYKFMKLTDTPFLLNTSLNLGGQPIYADRRQCQQLLNAVDIDGMVLGSDFVYRSH